MQQPRWIEYLPLDDLVPAARNPMHDSEAIRGSISRHGVVEPCVLDERTGRLVVGHGRRDDLLARRAVREPMWHGLGRVTETYPEVVGSACGEACS